MGITRSGRGASSNSLDENDRDVVVAPRLVGRDDQLLADLLETARPLKEPVSSSSTETAMIR